MIILDTDHLTAGMDATMNAITNRCLLLPIPRGAELAVERSCKVNVLLRDP